MDYKNACHILKIQSPFSDDELKKAYRTLILKYHPDKSKKDTSVQFQEIHEAYLFLQENEEQAESVLTYVYQQSKHIYFSLLHHLPDESLIQIYEFLLNQEKKMTVSIKDHIYDILKQRRVVELNPTLKHLINSEVYSLHIKDELYYIPLWHSELNYPNHLKVICIPELPSHIMIDNNNNIHVSITIRNKQKKNYTIRVGDHQYDFILTDEIIEQKQKIVSHNGIPRIQSDIYNVSEKGDIICQLSFRD